MTPTPQGPPSTLPGLGQALAYAGASQRARDAVDAATRAVDKVLWDRAVRSAAANLAAISKSQGALANAALEGAELAPGALATPGGDRESPMGQVVASALDLGAGAPRFAGLITVTPMQALAEAATVVGRRFVPLGELGRPRAVDNCDDPLHLPGLPPAQQVAPRLQELGRVLVASKERGVLVAAVVHAELALLRPFTWGSGLVARGSVRWILAAKGVDPDMLTVPESGFRELGRAGYVRALKGYASGSEDGVASWVQVFADIVVVGSQSPMRSLESSAPGGS